MIFSYYEGIFEEEKNIVGNILRILVLGEHNPLLVIPSPSCRLFLMKLPRNIERDIAANIKEKPKEILKKIGGPGQDHSLHLIHLS